MNETQLEEETTFIELEVEKVVKEKVEQPGTLENGVVEILNGKEEEGIQKKIPAKVEEAEKVALEGGQEKVEVLQGEEEECILQKRISETLVEESGDLNDIAAFKNFKKWCNIEFPLLFGRDLSATESFIHGPDEKTNTSLKVKVLNPIGKIWTKKFVKKLKQVGKGWIINAVGGRMKNWEKKLVEITLFEVLVETKKLNVSWYVDTDGSRLVLLASGMQCKAFNGFQLSFAGIIRLPKLEMIMAKSEANNMTILVAEDVYDITVYSRIHCLQVDSYAVVQQGSLPIYPTRIAGSLVDNVLLVHQDDAKGPRKKILLALAPRSKR